VALAGEGGHIEIMPVTDDEWIAWRAAHDQFGRVSAERLLSGMGLSHIHAALSAEMGTPLDVPLTPAQVTDGAMRAGDPICRRAFDAFCGMLGSVAADVALVLGARGGVYIGGGIVPRFVDALRASTRSALSPRAAWAPGRCAGVRDHGRVSGAAGPGSRAGGPARSRRAPRRDLSILKDDACIAGRR
jgi:glucokinase